MFNRGLLYLALACLVLNVLTVLSQDESSVDVSPRVLLYKASGVIINARQLLLLWLFIIS